MIDINNGNSIISITMNIDGIIITNIINSS